MAHHHTIRTLVKATLDGKTVNRQAGSHAWYIGTTDDDFYLKHYATIMLRWNREGAIVYESLGHGSVSDQAGVNAALATLDADFRMSRVGGAHWYSWR